MPREPVPLVPGAAIARAALPPSVLRRLRARLLAELGAVPEPPDERERLISAWEAGFVEDAADACATRLAPLVDAMSSRDSTPSRATLFVASHLRPTSTHAHQDIAYRWRGPMESRYAWTTWITLDPCDENSGALLFSGAAPRDPVEERVDFLADDFQDRAATPAWRRAEVVARVSPGDVVIFDARVWHAAAPCRAGRSRKALAIRWRSGDGWEERLHVPAPQAHPDRFGMDTAGRRLVESARLAGFSSEASSAGELAATPARPDSGIAPDARRAFADRARASRLSERHGGRIAADVWRSVRHRGMPALERRIHPGDHDGLA